MSEYRDLYQACPIKQIEYSLGVCANCVRREDEKGLKVASPVQIYCAGAGKFVPIVSEGNCEDCRYFRAMNGYDQMRGTIIWSHD